MDVARVSSSDDEQRLLVVYAIQRLLALAPDEETLLRECCALLAQYRHYRLVWSGFAEPGGTIRIVASSGAARHYLDGVEPRWDDTLAGRGNAGWVIRHGQSRVVRIPGPWNLALGARARAFGIDSLLTLPLRIEGSVVGVIAAYSDEVDGFEEKESRLLEGLADDIARALQLLRVRASAADEMARSRDRLRRLEAVRRLFADIGGEIDARRTVLLDEGARALGMDVAVVGSVEGDLLRYQLMVLDNVASHPGSLIPLERTVGGIAIAERRTCSWQDLAAEPGLEAEMNLRARGYRCALATPFEVDGRFFALAFAAHAAREDPFAEEDHVYVELLASLFAQFMRDNRQQEQIRDLRTLDQLTGLPNRANFEMRLAEATSARDAQQRPFAVIGLDLDRFRGINTALGFAIGDRLLVQTAERLRSVLREGDVLARTGGDGFGIIAEARTPEAAADIATRLSNRLAEPANIDGNEVALSASIGIALYPSDASNPTELVACAASALAAVRVEGGSQPFRFYSQEIGARLDAKRRFHRDVIRAREREEYRLYFQPEVDLRTGRVVAAEALLRWHDSESGLRSAAQFVPLAEETGLISWLDHWALRTAVAQIRRWEHAGRDLVVACNLSGYSVQEAALLDELRELLSESGIDPSHLQIELTETVAMRDVTASSTFLHGCHALGVSVALDDFGTGYSSLMHLKRLPVDTLKIDGSFVSGLPNNEEDVAIVRATIALGHSLGRRVVAEWVENEAQALWLASEGCDLAQGYWYARAMPVERFEAWMDG